MKEYNIEIVETLRRAITVTASDEERAMQIVKDRYFNEEIVLDYSDSDLVEFNNVEE